MPRTLHRAAQTMSTTFLLRICEKIYYPRESAVLLPLSTVGITATRTEENEHYEKTPSP